MLIPEEGDAEIADVLSFAGMLSDLSADEEAAFDEVLRQPLRLGRETGG